MNEQQVSHAEIMRAICELKTEIRADNTAVWNAITKLNDEMSTGRGGIKVLVWLGGFLIAMGSLFVTVLHR